jgi:hypothetical protein
MAEAKIEIKVGAVSFSGEGEGKWLSEQLDKVIEKLPQLASVAPAQPSDGGGGGGGAPTHPIKKGNVGTLAAFLTGKKATSNRRKFLATALWLHDSTGNPRITTGEVKQALKNNSQGKLANASSSLNDNVAKGWCEKDGASGFFVTDPGRTEIG